jgi:hypothetical protein
MMDEIVESIQEFFRWLKTHHDELEIILLTITIVVAYILYKETKEQVKISDNSLVAQKSQWRSDSVSQHIKDSTQRYNDSLNGAYQRKRDNATLANAQRSLELTAEISQATIQPFLCVDTIGLIENLTVDRMPSVRFTFKNSGPTPAYTVVAKSFIIWEDQIEKYLHIDSTLYAIDSIGFIVGREGTMDAKALYYGGSAVFSKADSAYYAQKHSLLLLTVIVYEDAFGNKHFTQQGSILNSGSSAFFVGLRKYTLTDHYEKHQTKTH